MANILHKIFLHKEFKKEKERMERISRLKNSLGENASSIYISDNVFSIPDFENETALVCCVGDDGLKIDAISLWEYSLLTKRLHLVGPAQPLNPTPEIIDDILYDIEEEECKTVKQYSISEEKNSYTTVREDEYDLGDRGVRFSLAPRKLTPEELAEVEARRKELEQEQLEREKQRKIQERIDELKNVVRQLRDLGLNADEIAKFVQPEQSFSRLKVTDDFRIVVPEKENQEIEIKPLPRALYILFLKHPEGINFKDLVDYKDEIQTIYNTITNRVHMDKASKSVEDLVDPTNNSVHEKCSRIKSAFMKLFGKAGAEQYAITGKAGEAKSIPAAKGFVDWEKK